jgi:heme/copper-type cytochrome/quinol oxidase subunit 1
LYNVVISAHALLIIFFRVIPVMNGFGNYFVPRIIGAYSEEHGEMDIAYPRLNNFGF